MREGKFFVSTSTLTSIVTTTNQCYKAVSSQATGMMTCKKRKSKITELVPLEIITHVFPREKLAISE